MNPPGNSVAGGVATVSGEDFTNPGSFFWCGRSARSRGTRQPLFLWQGWPFSWQGSRLARVDQATLVMRKHRPANDLRQTVGSGLRNGGGLLATGADVGKGGSDQPRRLRPVAASGPLAGSARALSVVRCPWSVANSIGLQRTTDHGPLRRFRIAPTLPARPILAASITDTGSKKKKKKGAGFCYQPGTSAVTITAGVVLRGRSPTPPCQPGTRSRPEVGRLFRG